MTTDLILAIDQGTTNTKATLVTATGSIVAASSVRVPLVFPRPGWVESDGLELWRTVEAAVAQCLASVDAPSIAAVAVANQRESALAWDRRTGELLGPCISWQCRRTASYCDELREAGYEGRLRERTGLSIDPLFSASKMRWLLERIENADARARRGELCVGTVDSWVLWNLTGGDVFATDLTNASRTQLLDLDRLRWDQELLDLFGVPIQALPDLRGSSARLGVTRGPGPIPPGLTVAALVGDSHAALFGHGAPKPGAVKATYGTGTSVMTPLEQPIRADGLSTTIAWSLEDPAGSGEVGAVYALEGNITATGAALEWLATILGLEGGEEALARLAESTDDTAGVDLVPAFAGRGAPFWDAEARGIITGLTRGVTRAHLARAAFESIAYQVRDVIDVLRAALPTELSTLLADGGAMRSDLLAQTQADLLRLPVWRAQSGSLAALGAAYLAGLATGLWGSLDDIRRLPRSFDRFEPAPNADALEAAYRGWRGAVRRAVSTPQIVPAPAGAEA
jgi:glycerol kinase